MDKEQFKQFFVISFLAERSVVIARHNGRRENETMNEEVERYAEVCWLHFCQIWPVADNPPLEGEEKD